MPPARHGGLPPGAGPVRIWRRHTVESVGARVEAGGGWWGVSRARNGQYKASVRLAPQHVNKTASGRGKTAVEAMRVAYERALKISR